MTNSKERANPLDEHPYQFSNGKFDGWTYDTGQEFNARKQLEIGDDFNREFIQPGDKVTIVGLAGDQVTFETERGDRIVLPFNEFGEHFE